jgi:hypothetical protein
MGAKHIAKMRFPNLQAIADVKDAGMFPCLHCGRGVPVAKLRGGHDFVFCGPICAKRFEKTFTDAAMPGQTYTAAANIRFYHFMVRDGGRRRAGKNLARPEYLMAVESRQTRSES